MFFRRAQRNRKLRTTHVLDVKLRSSQVQAARFRIAVFVLATLFAVFFGSYVLWRCGSWAMARLVYQNPAFAIREVDIRTDGIISLDQLRRWSGVKPGDNLFALDLMRVKRDLELVPLVHSVSIERTPPRQLRIRVSERVPLAEVRVPSGDGRGGMVVRTVLLDHEGFALLPLDPRQTSLPPGQTNDPLPVITGVNTMELQPGRRVDSVAVNSALHLIERFTESPMAGVVELWRLDVSSPEVVVATTSHGSQITFGLADLDRQLRRWREIYDQSQRFNVGIASLDLAVGNNIPVKWVQLSAAPRPAPRVVRPTRPRRPHV